MIITLSPIRLNTKKAQTQNWTHQSTKINSAGGNEGSERTFQASRSNQSEARSAKRRRGLDPIGRWAVAIATGEPPRTPAPRLARAAVNSALITSQDLNVRNLLTRTFEIWHSVETRKRRFVLCIFLAFHTESFSGWFLRFGNDLRCFVWAVFVLRLRYINLIRIIIRENWFSV